MNLNFDLRQTLGGIVCLLAADFLLMLDSAVTGWIAPALFMIGLFVCWAGLSKTPKDKKED